MAKSPANIEPAKPLSLLAKSEYYEIAEKNASSLIPAFSSASEKLLALNEMLETPFISGSKAAEEQTIVTVLRVGSGEVEAYDEPGTFVEQWMFLCRLQTPLQYVSKTGEIHDHKEGETVLLGLSKNRIRSMFAEIVQEATAAGEVMPNVLIKTVPSKNPRYNDAVTFRQLPMDATLQETVAAIAGKPGK